MHVRHESAGQVDEPAAPGARVHHPQHGDGPAREPSGTPVRAIDPRLSHVGTAAPALMALQRSAGNAAVASLVGQRVAVQRMPVEIGEMETHVGVSEAPPAPTGGGASTGGAAGGAVTSDGTSTTINGASITLAAPMTTANGVLRADTIIADSVVASSYTPGAGNVW